MEGIVDDDRASEVAAQHIEVFDERSHHIETGIAVQAVLDEGVRRIQQMQDLVSIFLLSD